MRSEMGKLVKKMGEVGTEMDHGDRDVVCPRMLVGVMQRTTIHGGCGPLGFESSGRWSGGIGSVSGGT